MRKFCSHVRILVLMDTTGRFQARLRTAQSRLWGRSKARPLCGNPLWDWLSACIWNAPSQEKNTILFFTSGFARM